MTFNQKAGFYPPPKGVTDILGLEVVGRKVLGDSSLAMSIVPGGSYAEFVKVRSEHLIEVPSNLSVSEAAAIPEAWLTALMLLRKIGCVEKGETVLIHGAASGVGTALIQLVKLYGATSIGVCSSEKKKEYLEK